MSEPNVPAYRSPAAALIAAHGGRVTRARIAVLETLQRSVHSLTHDDIAAALDAAGIPQDRVTLYRSLDWLVERGLAHRISGPDRAWRFNAGGGGMTHAHFHCERCGHVYCLASVSPGDVFSLPEGFLPERSELVFHGMCPDCGKLRSEKR